MSGEEPPSKKIRRRRPKFREIEVNILVEEALKRSWVIAGKHDPKAGVNEAAKQQAWVEIATAVNAVSNVGRTAEELRRKFRDLKCSTKLKTAPKARHIEDTGGGEPIEVKYTMGELEMLKFLSSTAVTGLPIPDSQGSKLSLSPKVTSAASQPSTSGVHSVNATAAAASQPSINVVHPMSAAAAAAAVASQQSTSEVHPTSAAAAASQPLTIGAQPSLSASVALEPGVIPSMTAELQQSPEPYISSNNHVHTTIIIGERKPSVPHIHKYETTSDLRPVSSPMLHQVSLVEKTKPTIPSPCITSPLTSPPGKSPALHQASTIKGSPSPASLNVSHPSSSSTTRAGTPKAGPEDEIEQMLHTQNDIRDLLQELVGFARQMATAQENIANAISSLANAVAGRGSIN